MGGNVVPSSSVPLRCSTLPDKKEVLLPQWSSSGEQDSCSRGWPMISSVLLIPQLPLIMPLASTVIQQIFLIVDGLLKLSTQSLMDGYSGLLQHSSLLELHLTAFTVYLDSTLDQELLDLIAFSKPVSNSEQ